MLCLCFKFYNCVFQAKIAMEMYVYISITILVCRVLAKFETQNKSPKNDNSDLKLVTVIFIKGGNWFHIRYIYQDVLVKNRLNKTSNLLRFKSQYIGSFISTVLD